MLNRKFREKARHASLAGPGEGGKGAVAFTTAGYCLPRCGERRCAIAEIGGAEIHPHFDPQRHGYAKALRAILLQQALCSPRRQGMLHLVLKEHYPPIGLSQPDRWIVLSAVAQSNSQKCLRSRSKFKGGVK